MFEFESLGRGEKIEYDQTNRPQILVSFNFNWMAYIGTLFVILVNIEAKILNKIKIETFC